MIENEKWHRHLGVYGICLYEDKLLVIQKGSGPYVGRFDLPGGTVEANESLTEALKREFIEEAGILVDVKRNIGACDFIIPYELPKRGTSHIHHVAVFYLVQCNTGVKISTPTEFEGQDSLGALWIPMNDITPGNSSPLIVQAIECLKTEQLPTKAQRLDDWVVLNSTRFN